MLFLNALDRFDIHQSAPHPPGFPYLVLAGKALSAVLGSGATALSSFGMLAGLAGCLGIYRLGLWLHGDGGLALASTLLWSFIPATWSYHGALYSDGPAVSVCVLALSYLATGTSHENRRDLALASLLSALALGIRPQAILLLFLPWLCFTAVAWRRRRFGVLARTLVVLVLGCLPIPIIIAANTGGLGALWEMTVGYAGLARRMAPEPPETSGGWLHVLRMWYLDPFGSYWPALAVVTLSLCGTISGLLGARRSRTLCSVATIAVYAPLALIGLHLYDAARYGLPVQAFVAVTAPVCLLRLRPVARTWIAAVTTVVLVGWFIAWCVPVIRSLRGQVPPVTAAIDFIREHRDPSRVSILVDTGAAHAKRGLPGVPMYSELVLPYVPQWRLVSGLDRFFEAERDVLRLTRERRPGQKLLFEASWPPERFRRIGRYRFYAAFVYEEPRRALLSVGWERSHLGGEEVVHIATPEALVFLPSRVSELTFDARPSHPEAILELDLFTDEAWARPDIPPVHLASHALRSDAWKPITCRVGGPTALAARALLFRTLSAGDTAPPDALRLRVRRLGTRGGR